MTITAAHAYRKLREIALVRECKVHDLILDGIDAVLREHGHPTTAAFRAKAPIAVHRYRTVTPKLADALIDHHQQLLPDACTRLEFEVRLATALAAEERIECASTNNLAGEMAEIAGCSRVSWLSRTQGRRDFN